MKVILTIWIFLKTLYARSQGWIHPLKEELIYVKKRITRPEWEYLKLFINYIPDKLFRSVWDWQYDSITTFKKGGGDCNSINRIVQCYFHLRGQESYLVTYIAKPFNKSHATCVIRKDDMWFSRDYGERSRHGFYKLETCLREIAKKYDAEVKTYCIQNIKWEFRNANKIAKG